MRLNKITDTCSMYELGRLWNATYSPFNKHREDYYISQFEKLITDLELDHGVIICNVNIFSIYDKPLRHLGFRPKFKYEGYSERTVITYILHIKNNKPYKYNWFTRFFENM